MKRPVICVLTLCCICLAALAADITYVAYPAESFVGPCLWRSGYLVSFGKRHTSRPYVPDVALFSAQGKLLYRTRIEVPDATDVTILDASAAADGTVAAAGWAQTPTSSFVALIDPSGKQKKLIRTSVSSRTGVSGRVFPSYVAISSDAVWTLGLKSDVTGRYEDKEDYGIVTKYALDGTQLGVFLPRSSFPRSVEPIGRPAGEVSYAGPKEIDTGWSPRTGIVVSGDRVGICLTATQEWTELTPAGDLIGRWSYASLGRGHASWDLRGMTLTPSGEVYAAIGTRDETNHMEGFAILKLDRKRSSWDVVAGNMNGRFPLEFVHFGALLGADETGLIFQARRNAPELAHWPLP